MLNKLKTLIASTTLSAVAGVVMTIAVGAAAIGYSNPALADDNQWDNICGIYVCCDKSGDGWCWPRGEGEPSEGG